MCERCVVGASYDARIFAQNQFDSVSTIRWAGSKLPYLYTISSRLGMNLYSNIGRPLRCNGCFDDPFDRRAMPIPAAACCAGRCESFSRYQCPVACSSGIAPTDMKTSASSIAIACNPLDILEVHHWLETQPDFVQLIAGKGQALVKSKHSVLARAAQVREALTHILRRDFMGSGWIAGSSEFKICNPSRTILTRPPA